MTTQVGAMPAELEKLLADPTFSIFYNASTLIVICAKPIGQHPDWDGLSGGAEPDAGHTTCTWERARLVWHGPCSSKRKSRRVADPADYGKRTTDHRRLSCIEKAGTVGGSQGTGNRLLAVKINERLRDETP